MKYFRIVPVRDSTPQNKAQTFSGKFRVVFRTIFRFEIILYGEGGAPGTPPRQEFYQTYARITGNQGFAQIFLGPVLALNTGE